MLYWILDNELWTVSNTLSTLLYLCYKLKTLELVKKKEPCIGFTQENLIENSVQDCISYILIPGSLCELFLVYSK